MGRLFPSCFGIPESGLELILYGYLSHKHDGCGFTSELPHRWYITLPSLDWYGFLSSRMHHTWLQTFFTLCLPRFLVWFDMVCIVLHLQVFTAVVSLHTMHSITEEKLG
jgi:hypothetical protein